MPGIFVWKVLEHSAQRLQKLDFNSSLNSLNAVSRQLPDGVYTTLRTFGGKRFLALDDHLRRLEESARLIGRPLELDKEAIREALGQAVQRLPAEEARVRISLGLQNGLAQTILALEPLELPPPEAYAHGVYAVTVPLQRDNPRSKQASFIETAEEVRRSLPPGVEEALMVGEDGRILEGLSSNFFAVKDGALWTAEQGVLQGITRSLVLEAVQKLGLPVWLESVGVTNLPQLEEAFITSSSRSVLPVRQIDEIAIGAAHPGPITKRLMEAYREAIEKRLESCSGDR